MKKMKLFLSVVLVIALAFSLFSISAFAASIKTTDGQGRLYVVTGSNASAYATTGGYYATAQVDAYNASGWQDSASAEGYNGKGARTATVYAHAAMGPGVAFYGYHYWETYLGDCYEGSTYYIY